MYENVKYDILKTVLQAITSRNFYDYQRVTHFPVNPLYTLYAGLKSDMLL